MAARTGRAARGARDRRRGSPPWRAREAGDDSGRLVAARVLGAHEPRSPLTGTLAERHLALGGGGVAGREHRLVLREQRLRVVATVERASALLEQRGDSLRGPLRDVEHLVRARRRERHELERAGVSLPSALDVHAIERQLLDFTRARSGGGLAIEPAETDLGQLVGQAIGELELSRPSWKIRPSMLGNLKGYWDANRLLQVVSNLLGNAGQHGRQGPIVIRLDGTVADAVEMEVQNEGVIPRDLLPQLFDPFLNTKYRSEGSSGLGLGLFIVQEIARAHGGKVDVRTSEEAGTTFVVRLPRRAARTRTSP